MDSPYMFLSLMRESSTGSVDLELQIPAMFPSTPEKTPPFWRPVIPSSINTATIDRAASTSHHLSQQQQDGTPGHLPASVVDRGSNSHFTAALGPLTNDSLLLQEWAKMDSCYYRTARIVPSHETETSSAASSSIYPPLLQDASESPFMMSSSNFSSVRSHRIATNNANSCMHEYPDSMDGGGRQGAFINGLANLLLHHQPIDLIERKTRGIDRVYETLLEPQANHKDKSLGFLEAVSVEGGNPIISFGGSYSQKLKSENHLEDNGHVDDSKTPPQKVKRKKHRPKVVREGKPAGRTPVSKAAATPKPQTSIPTDEIRSNGKRKYMRKNKSSNASNGVLHQVEVQDDLCGTRSVRRSLNFDSDVNTRVNLSSVSTETEPSKEGTRESQARETQNADLSGNFSSKTIQGAKARDAAENLLAGASELGPIHMTKHHRASIFPNVYETPSHPQAYDLNRVMARMNQIHNGNGRLPEDYPSLFQISVMEMERENMRNQLNHINVNILDVMSKGTKRGTGLTGDPVDIASRTDINFMTGNEVNQSQGFGGTGHCYNSNVMQKRRKTLNMDEISYQPSIAAQGCYTLTQLMWLKDNGKFPCSEIISKHNIVEQKERFSTSVEAQNFTNNANMTRNNLPFPARPPATLLSQRTTSCQPRTPELHSKNGRDAGGFSGIQKDTDIVKIINEKASVSQVVSINYTGDLDLQGRQTSSPNLSASHMPGQVMQLAQKYFQGKGPNHQLISSMHDSQGSTAKKSQPYRMSKPRAVSSLDYIIQKLLRLKLDEGTQKDIDHVEQNALVPYVGSNALIPYEDPTYFIMKRRPRPKVHLDDETSRVWKLLMLKDSIHDDSEMDENKKKWWEEERRVFRGRVDSFIARMHLVQGDRRFSPWKGSVVDSVVGVFLTQNVSDHLSSSAFMSMAARFQLGSIQANKKLKSEVTNISGEQSNSYISSTSTTSNVWQEQAFGRGFFNQSSIRIYDAEKVKEPIADCKYSAESDSKQIDCSLTDGKGHAVITGEGRPPQESSTDSSLTAVTSAKSVGNEDKQSPDDIASSQTSAFSSQNSSEYPVPTYDPAGTCLGLNLDVEELSAGIVPDNLYMNTSFMDLLRMTERKLPGVCAVDGQNSDNFDALINLEHMPAKEGKTFPNLEEQSYGETQQSNSLGIKHPSPTPFFAPGYYDSKFVNLENNCRTRAECSYASSSTSVDRVTTGNDRGMSCLAFREDIAGTVSHSSVLMRSIPSIDTCKGTSELRQPLGSLEGEMCTDEQLCPNRRLPRENAVSYTNNFWTPHVSQGGNAFGKRTSHGEHHISTAKAVSDVQVPKGSPTINSNFLKSQDKKADPANLTRKSDFKNEVADTQKASLKIIDDGVKLKRKVGKEKENSFDWDSLRRKFFREGPQKERCFSAKDSVDWEAVREASVEEISDTIRERGMNNLLAERIKAFLDRLVKDHGAIDLEWLREVPPDKAKEYLLSIRGLGLKSVECVRLLTLHHLAFPVDTNVGRISVRLGWVPLQPLPESLQLHLLELYPVLETIQKYLWPRLCTLDQRTLYELHYQLITFGKVFCTKSKPNCNACPMRAECKHFASAFSSARLALPGPEEYNKVTAVVPIIPENTRHVNSFSVSLQQLEACTRPPERTVVNKSEPIVEEPASPEPQHYETTEKDIEDAFYEDPDEIPTIKLNFEGFTQKLHDLMEENNWEQGGDMSKALVALSPQIALLPMPKLKNISRLRTEHQVYELPDSHPLLERLDPREQDDPCFYLLAIWTPGETAQSTEPPEVCCNSAQTGKLCDKNTCFGCNTIRETQMQAVRGTLLIPCRTAMRGSFPLNGTYFQVNEVFADHNSSYKPILVPRELIWNLRRRTVYFGTSIPTIFRGLTTEGIQQCFWKGFVCVRGFDRTTRAPKPLYARLHFPASKAHRKANWSEQK